MHVLALRIDLRIPISESLKAKRSAITPIVEGARRRFRVASAEVGRQDDRHRAELGFARCRARPATPGRSSTRWSASCGRSPRSRCIEADRTWLEEE